MSEMSALPASRGPWTSRRRRTPHRPPGRPALALLPSPTRSMPALSPAELHDDLLALVDAGLIEVAPDAAGQTRYRLTGAALDPFAASDVLDAIERGAA